jgi:predicted ArsR family transcriptional regulator
MTCLNPIPTPAADLSQKPQVVLQPAVLKLLQVAEKSGTRTITLDAISKVFAISKTTARHTLRQLKTAGLIAANVAAGQSSAKWQLTEPGRETTPEAHLRNMQHRSQKLHYAAMQRREATFCARAKKLRTAMQKNGQLSTPELSNFVNLNPSTTRGILRQMEARGMVKCHTVGPRKQEWSLS